MDTSQNSVVLKVKEALVKDVGRAIARMDPIDMKAMGLEPGDIVMIEGKRKTPVKVMPCFAEDRGKQILQIDGVTRENSQAGIDEKIRIEKTTCKAAIKIRLQPDTATGSQYKSNDTRYIGSLIDGLPVSKNDKIRANLFGSRSVDYIVVDTNPSGVVLVNSNTKLDLNLPKQGEKKIVQSIL